MWFDWALLMTFKISVYWNRPVWSLLFFFVKQGIQFLLENDLLQNTPEDIAQFLYKGEGLNKTVIGDYLGERWALQFSICFPPTFLFPFLIALFNLLCMCSDMGIKPQEIGSLDLLSYFTVPVKYLSGHVVLIDEKSMGIGLSKQQEFPAAWLIHSLSVWHLCRDMAAALTFPNESTPASAFIFFFCLRRV